jgi:AAA domain-containing protein
MARALLVVPTMAGAGLARTCLGLVRALDRRGVNVAFVKPVAQPRADGGPDRSIALAAATTALRPPDPLSTADLEQQLGSSGLDAVLEKVVAAWQPVHDRSDVVVVEGLSPGSARLYASGLNQALAKAIDADVLLVASWPAAGVGTGEDLADRAAELKLGPLPRRAQRDPAGRSAPYRRDRAGPTGMGAHPGRVRHRPAHSCGRRRQLRDRDARARPRPGIADR